MVVHVCEASSPAQRPILEGVSGLVSALGTLGEAGVLVTDVISPEVSFGVTQVGYEPKSFSALLQRGRLVHIHGWGKMAREVLRSAQAAKRPVIASPLGAFDPARHRPRPVTGFWRRFTTRRAAARATVLTALNGAEREALKALGIAKDVAILPYGFSPREPGSSRDSIPCEAEGLERILVMPGRIDPREGSVMLLKAFGELGGAAQGWTLVLVGPVGSDRKKMLDAAVFRKGGLDRVRIVAAGEWATVRQWIRTAKVVVVPSLCVGYSWGFFEAVANGVGVLASSVAIPGGDDLYPGSFAPNRDALKAVLRPILEMNDGQLTEWNAICVAWVRSRLEWSRIAQEFRDLYRDVAGPGRPRVSSLPNAQGSAKPLDAAVH